MVDGNNLALVMPAYNAAAPLARTVAEIPPTENRACRTADQNLGAFEFAAAIKEVVGPGHGLPPNPSH